MSKSCKIFISRKEKRYLKQLLADELRTVKDEIEIADTQGVNYERGFTEQYIYDLAVEKDTIENILKKVTNY